MPTLGGDLTVSEGGSGSGAYVGSDDLKRGDSVERYLILSILGSGGMGSVYGAHDPELDRKVAVKIVRPSERMKALVADARQTLSREAQALARLSHPNVVAVHDVGDYEDGIFIAMEFVDGVTLRRWPQTANPDWREVLDVLIAAGRGLAAAHDEDIIHRDFKPDNVMVDRSGRVCVLDFGLAAQEGEALATIDRRKGTPAYMAPERHDLQAADGRADQFSFCVALYELLYKQRPFSGDKPDEIAIQILRGRVRPPPKGPVPAWVGRAVMRGLARDSDDRWPDMHELLAELSGRTTRRRRALSILGVGAALGAAAAWGMMSEPAPPCTSAGAPALAVWGEGEREAVANALQRTALPFAATTQERATAIVDAYSLELADALVGACNAEATRPGPETALLLACLHQRTAELGATADVLVSADRVSAPSILDVVAALTPVAECDSADPAAYADVLENDKASRLLDELAEAQAVAAAGKGQDAEQRLRPILDESIALHWSGTEARARTSLGEILSEHGDPADALAMLEGAVEAAARSGSDRLLLGALLGLIDHHSSRGKTERVFALAPAARAAQIRLGTGRDSARLEVSLGNAHVFEGEYAAAERAYRKAIEVARADERETVVPTARFNLGSLQFIRGDYVGARETFLAQVKVSERLYGEGHPRTMQQRTNHADALLMLGQPRAAKAVYEEALTLLEAVEGASAAERGRVEQHLAEALGELGHLDEALAYAEQAAGRLEKAYGAGYYHAAAVRSTLAELRRWRGEHEAEEREARAAAEALSETVGPDNAATAVPRTQLAVALVRRGALDEARQELQRAQAALEGLNPDHPALVLVHLQWARLHAQRGDVAQATLAGQRANELAQGLSAKPVERALAVHLKALLVAWADPADPEVHKLASRAEGLYQEIAPHPDADLEGVQALLNDPAAAVRVAFGEPTRG